MRMRHFARKVIISGFILGLFLISPALSIPAESPLSQNMQDILRRINAGEFGGGGRRGGSGGGRWVDGGLGYVSIERNPKGGSDIVRYETTTGKREVLLSAEQLTPPALGKPLEFSEYTPSADGKRILFGTNGRLVMIRKTALDYWILDRTDNSWHKLGGNAAGGLLYAKLSPDGTRAAYVRENNIYVEDIESGAVKQLTADGSPLIINGTSDYVNEEELSLRDTFEWSPDGRKIAYLQFDDTGVPEFALINYTDTLYPVITKYAFPKPGQTNAAVRAGVVSADGGPTVWIKTPGDPREYLYRPHGLDRESSGNHPPAFEPPPEYERRSPGRSRDGRRPPDVPGQGRRLAQRQSELHLARKRQPAAFHQRAGRMAACLRRVQDRRRPPHHDRALRSRLDLGSGRKSRLALLHRLTRERHPALPLSLASRREGKSGTDEPGERARHAHVHRLAQLRLRVSRILHVHVAQAFPISSICPTTRSSASSRTTPTSRPRSSRCSRDGPSSSRSISARA